MGKIDKELGAGSVNLWPSGHVKEYGVEIVTGERYIKNFVARISATTFDEALIVARNIFPASATVVDTRS